jgi:dihydrofolate reductase
MIKVKMSTPNLTAIVAATKSNGIGLNGGLPWRLPGEMKYFAKGKSTGNKLQAARPYK